MTLESLDGAAIAGICIGLAGAACADVRWWRVAQREHYLAGSVSRFDSRWTFSSRANAVVRVVGLIGLVLSPLTFVGAAVVAVASAVRPLGLSMRGGTAKLVWTRRLRMLAIVTVVLQVIAVLIGWMIGEGAAVAAAAVASFFAPLFVDSALTVLAPLEKRNAQQFVDSAKQRLQSVAPTVVAITGSYGKTTTKQYVSHLLSATTSVFASPASFNNRAGLSRAVNEQLVPGTQVFIAEMGTYGPGEIAELCEVFPPDIAVMTAIGPVHLERFGSENAIIEAKSEIFAKAKICVLNVDDDRLAKLADILENDEKTVWRVASTHEIADVIVAEEGDDTVITAKGAELFRGPRLQAPPTNVGCAVAVALHLRVPRPTIAQRLVDLPVPDHRQQVGTSADGVIVIDDTFNANPAGVRRALALLAQQGAGQRVVVTPGMVELGKLQNDENRSFAAEAAKVADTVIVVGRTNRQALVDGVVSVGSTPVVVDRLPGAVAWVRQHIGAGDAVAYINDLPDHFP